MGNSCRSAIDTTTVSDRAACPRDRRAAAHSVAGRRAAARTFLQPVGPPRVQDAHGGLCGQTSQLSADGVRLVGATEIATGMAASQAWSPGPGATNTQSVTSDPDTTGQVRNYTTGPWTQVDDDMRSRTDGEIIADAGHPDAGPRHRGSGVIPRSGRDRLLFAHLPRTLSGVPTPRSGRRRSTRSRIGRRRSGPRTHEAR